MDILKAAVLGAVQGFTEFLPVSSSGHLVLAREILRVPEALLAFDVLVHLGTLAAVVVVFRKEVAALIAAACGVAADVVRGTSPAQAIARRPQRRLAWLIAVASAPTAIMGAALEPLVRSAFSSRLAVGALLVATGTLLWVAEGASRRRARTRTRIEEFGSTRSFLVGVAQGLAVMPGFSRSGATIGAGLLLGLERGDAVRFSFLLSVPVILGASLLELPDMLSAGASRGLAVPFLVGAAVSAISGYVAIHLVSAAVSRRKLRVFAVYTWLVGLAAIAIEATGM